MELGLPRFLLVYFAVPMLASMLASLLYDNCIGFPLMHQLATGKESASLRVVAVQVAWFMGAGFLGWVYHCITFNYIYGPEPGPGPGVQVEIREPRRRRGRKRRRRPAVY